MLPQNLLVKIKVSRLVIYWQAELLCDSRVKPAAVARRTFTLTDANNYGYNASSSGPGTAGQYTREAGFLAYYEVSIILWA